MKKLYLKALLIAGLATLPLLASAEEWRRDGLQIFYRQPGERQWHRAPGTARELGDGWVIGNDRVYGGYGIYRWNGRGWDRAPGAAVRIGGSYQSPWVVNDRGERFSWNGYDWRPEGFAGRSDRFRDERRRDDWRDRDHERDSYRPDDDRRDDNRAGGDWRR